MPKEVVHTQSTPFMPVLTWDRDRDLRLGLMVSDSTLIESLYGNSAEAIGKAFRAVEFDSTNLSDEDVGTAIIEAIARVSPYESLWAELSRAECNRLVAMLRRARNAVFGADE